MKKLFYVALLLTGISLASCQKNYYSNFGNKKEKGCGCPSSKGV
jgi:hypothetical protein